MNKKPEMHINYSRLVDKAMRTIVKDLLKMLEKDGLFGDHYFLISFLTGFNNVQISKRLKEKYPEEMTIILQHQFEDLTIFEDGFSVKLSFDGIKENVEIPFDAVTSFVDPSTRFALQFNPELAQVDQKKMQNAKYKKSEAGTDKVIVLDNFRKK